MTTTTTAASSPSHVLKASIGHDEAITLAETAYSRFAGAVAALDESDWAHPTDCTGWTVRHLVGHVVGAMRAAASMREMASLQLDVRRHVKLGENQVDALTQIQIDRTAALTATELAAECERLVGPATKGRKRTPSLVRRLARFKVDLGNGVTERWSIGYLNDVILTRDAWLHRVDLSRAVGTELELTPDHDGRIIADVADEWFARHGRPCELVLTGPAGGRFGTSGGERYELDAVEFCRIMSGRATGTGLLTTLVPF
ncbi:MAG TPA: maleylpyruvate isomerase family mycothiol-dependent enzyme [Ilumatobacteraceae bacterium]|nr:maleylpyruvate isomerase family mycothiol-dependent enzyme [Ilumatobacteraceae bacterium]